MKAFIKIACISTLLFSFVGMSALLAQPVIRGDYDYIDSLAHRPSQKQKMTPQVSVELGTNFSSYGNGNSGIGTYIAPKVSMPVSDKLTMSVGIGYSSMFFNGPAESGLSGTSSSYGSVFVSGSYQVNEKLVVRGTAYKTFLLNTPQNGASLNSRGIDFSKQGFMFDAEYKVNEKFRIGVSVEYIDSNQPSYYQNRNSGFGNSTIGGSPFQTSPFGPRL